MGGVNGGVKEASSHLVVQFSGAAEWRTAAEGIMDGTGERCRDETSTGYAAEEEGAGSSDGEGDDLDADRIDPYAPAEGEGGAAEAEDAVLMMEAWINLHLDRIGAATGGRNTRVGDGE